ncbi:hypothetical protein F4808DRAFT_143717 [Astrocystis sublimbata]|nr:hypothetical protein F4808DRAFT_143717 [Astrocystis sublimbata]
MASLHSISSFGPHGPKYKVDKPKAKTAVKPILKKWAQSEREKRSVDLDRGCDEQDVQYRSAQGWSRTSTLSFHTEVPAGTGNGTSPGAGAAPSTDGVGLGVSGGTTATRRYNHSRSISSTSHNSGTTINSTKGMPAPRQAGATFVHPFQQTPRTSSPPLLSYANSLTSIADTRDYSPTTITEDDNDNSDGTGGTEAKSYQHHYSNSTGNNGSNLYTHHVNFFGTSNSQSQPTLMSQPLGSQCPSSTDISDENSPKSPPQPLLRISTSRTSSIPTHSSRLANVSSRSDLRLERIGDSPVSSNNTPITAAPRSSSRAPMSPLLRTSLDSSFPRLRAKSDLDTATRAEHVRAARRKFETKERAKDEKHAREEVRRRERADNKRAQQIEKQLAAQHKEHLATRAREDATELEEAIQRGKHYRKVSVASSGRPSLSLTRPSLSLGRPSMSRKNTSTQVNQSEKFVSSAYHSTDPHSPPTHGMEAGTAQSLRLPSKQKSKAKKKTKGAWTAFILWLRTKLLRMGKS